MWTLACMFIPSVLYYSWITYIISAGTGCVIWYLGQCRAFVERLAEHVSSYGSKAVSNLHPSPSPLYCAGEGTRSSDKKDNFQPRSRSVSPKPPLDARLGPRSLGSWVRIWDATRKAQAGGCTISASTTSSRSQAPKSSQANASAARSRSPTLPRGRSPFLPEDQLYLHHRLPLHGPPTARTVKLHFAHLPFVYQDLADRCLARAAKMSPGPARERRQRMWMLATRLAKRHRGLDVTLSDRFVKTVLDRNSCVKRPSKYWESVLEEVEKANASWSITRHWVAFYIVQSIVVTLISRMLPPTAHAALMAANAAAYMWSANVLWDTVHARYAVRKADEQELHDLMGGL